jgi:hypothetical protein
MIVGVRIEVVAMVNSWRGEMDGKAVEGEFVRVSG